MNSQNQPGSHLRLNKDEWCKRWIGSC